MRTNQVESGASQTYPMQIDSLKKGDYVVLKGTPCKITEITTCKCATRCKANIIGIDIFTDKIYEDTAPISHNIDVPNVIRKEYQLIDIQEDGFISLMLDDGSIKEDLRLPTDENYSEMVEKLNAAFEEGKEILVSVIAALGEEKIISFRESATSDAEALK